MASDARAPGRVRLQKLLAAAGIASRRRAEDLIRTGRVEVGGKTAKLGDSADPLHDDVRLDGESIRAEKPVYWVVHKPVGMLTTVRDPEGRSTILELIPRGTERLFPVGRLDKDTSGLVLLTNDGRLTQALLHPSHEVEREYVVTARGELDERAQTKLAAGVYLEEGRTAPAHVARVRYDDDADVTTLHLTLKEGRKRQIRRSLRAVGHPVRQLRRIRMGPLRLGSLDVGQARRLTTAERKALEAHVQQVEGGGAGGADTQPHGKVRRKAGRRKRKPGAPRRSPR